MLASMLDGLLCPKSTSHLDGFIGAWAPLGHGNPGSFELRWEFAADPNAKR